MFVGAWLVFDVVTNGDSPFFYVTVMFNMFFFWCLTSVANALGLVSCFIVECPFNNEKAILCCQQ